MEVEWLILAEAAQVVDSKMYMLGGGWDQLTTGSDFPLEHRFAIAILAPVDKTNQAHPFTFVFMDEEGASDLANR